MYNYLIVLLCFLFICAIVICFYIAICYYCCLLCGCIDDKETMDLDNVNTPGFNKDAPSKEEGDGDVNIEMEEIMRKVSLDISIPRRSKVSLEYSEQERSIVSMV